MKNLILSCVFAGMFTGCYQASLQCSGQCSHKDTLLVIVQPYATQQESGKLSPVDFLLVNNAITERTYEKNRENSAIIEKILSQTKIMNN